jgi:hypothetical protein
MAGVMVVIEGRREGNGGRKGAGGGLTAAVKTHEGRDTT